VAAHGKWGVLSALSVVVLVMIFWDNGCSQRRKGSVMERLKANKIGFAALAMLFGLHSEAATIPSSSVDLFTLSLDELSQLKVTSVSRRAEELRYAPSAIYVITADDIRRSGASSVAEALRLVPGMNVSRIGAHQWSISARGFDDVYSNKLLVLLDGRSVYSPLFSAVTWNVQDTVLEDIERIEVIRGPGAVMWGANAENGVVNIITRSAQDTQGTLVSASAGTEDRGILTARHGTQWGGGSAGRAYVKITDRDGQERVGLGRGDDQWSMLRSGFRIDSNPILDNTYTVLGNVYGVKKGTYSTQPNIVPPNYYTQFDDPNALDAGANLLGRWRHRSATDGQMTMQMYYDSEHRDVDNYFASTIQTADIEIQYVPAVIGRHSWIWGASARYIDDKMGPGALILNPNDDHYTQAAGFLQYGYAIIENTLDVTLGTKLQYNEFADLEALPSARLLWRPQPNRSIWSAVSRTVRSPSRVDQGVDVVLAALPPQNPPPVPTLIVRRGNPDYASETLVAYEFGFREQLFKTLSFDLATFYNRYEDERAQVSQGAPVFVPGPPSYVLLNVMPEHGQVKTHTWGFEYVLDWQPIQNWQLQAWYSFLRRVDHFSDDPALFAATPGRRVEEDRDQASLRSYWQKGRFELDSRVRYVDAHRAIDIDQYTELDLRFGWHLHPHVRMSMALTNLLDNGHMEGRSPAAFGFLDAEVERAASIGIEWRANGF
jgi:iron complex outermembrane receptor protein